MCRYAMSTYKPHYACFNCRKAFKRKLMSDIQRGEKTKIKAKCPECGSLMASMGLDFAPPRKENIKEWEHLARLYKVGITFYSCGCSGSGYIPNTKERLITHFEELKMYFTNWRKRKEPETQPEADKDRHKNWNYILQMPGILVSDKKIIKNEDAINYWIERIKEIEDKLILLKAAK